MQIEYKQEFLSTIEADIKNLLVDHWEEIALNKENIKLNPNWEAYYEIESKGKLSFFSVRDNGVLVGYFVAFVDNNIHYQDHVFATNDVIFIDKKYRKSSVGANLIRFAEECLRDDGVSVLVINTKIHQPFDELLDHLGFNNIERVYSKYLKG